MVNDEIGRAGVPAHYADESGREVIDIIRDQLGDAGFAAYCAGNVIKYRRRAGKKGGAEEAAKDGAKALFYSDMLSHLNGKGLDPRAARGRHSLDLERAIMEKMKYNAGRPYKHGRRN